MDDAKRIMNLPRSLFIPERARGFSIIEIMVGLTVSLIATLVIFQMYVAFEGQKRSTTTGADAAENGMIALFTIDRDARMAGTGVANVDLLSCTSIYSYFDDGAKEYSPAPGFGDTGALMPVHIVDGGGAADTVSFTYGNSVRSGISTTLSKTMSPTASELNVVSTAGFRTGDLVIVVQNGNCTVMQITQVQSSAYKLNREPGKAPSYNPPATYQNAETWPAYTAGAQVFSLGGGIAQHTYSVGTSGPTSALMSQRPTDVAPIATVGGIVSLKAQYGVAPSNSQQVNCWVNATKNNQCDTSDWSNPSSANILRIKAVRIAVVARSALSEKAIGDSCATTASPPISWTGGPTIDLSADPNWSCYRYKTYQTITPFRNVLWANL